MSIRIDVKSTGEDKLSDIGGNLDKAMRAAARDFPRYVRMPIRQAIQSEYKVKASHISAATKGYTVSGYTANQKYTGAVLSAKDFGLKPRTRPKNKRAYSMSINVRGGSKTFGGKGTREFIGPNNHAFKRKDKSRLPIERMNVLSVPAMINTSARPGVEQAVERVSDERTSYYLEKFLK